jgi:hypothetical protein
MIEAMAADTKAGAWTVGFLLSSSLGSLLAAIIKVGRHFSEDPKG